MALRFICLLMLLFFTLPLNAGISKVLCKNPEYKCYRVKSRDSWRSLFPDESERELVMRINRLNTQIWGGMTIAIPRDLEDLDILRYSPFPLQISATKERIIVVDPNAQAWGAYDEEGNLVRWGPASSGANWCKDVESPCQTHAGSFRIYSLGNSDCYSTKFPLPDGGAPMPYCMYFNGGQALHGEPNGLPGYNASHGCVRLYVNDAEWLRYDFVEGPNANNNYRGTRVDVLAYGDEITNPTPKKVPKVLYEDEEFMDING